MKKYEKPQMRVHVMASHLLLVDSPPVQMQADPTQEGDGVL